MWLCASMPCSQIVTLHAWACDYACTCMWLCAPMLCSQLVTKHACACMHIFYTQSARNYVCMSMWLCIFMLWGQPVTMHACACDYAYPCYAASVIMKAWHFLCTFTLFIQLVTMQSSRDYACLCLWLCKYIPCSQFVNLHAWACEYAHLRWADSLRLCMHVHVIMPIYAMQPVCNYVQELELCNFMPCSHLVTMHACACDYAHLQHAVRL